MTQCKLCMRAAAAAMAVNREVADGADVVFTDTVQETGTRLTDTCTCFWYKTT